MQLHVCTRKGNNGWAFLRAQLTHQPQRMQRDRQSYAFNACTQDRFPVWEGVKIESHVFRDKQTDRKDTVAKIERTSSRFLLLLGASRWCAASSTCWTYWWRLTRSTWNCVEIIRRTEHIFHVGHRRHVPLRNTCIEIFRIIKHPVHICDGGYVPLPDRSVCTVGAISGRRKCEASGYCLFELRFGLRGESCSANCDQSVSSQDL